MTERLYHIHTGASCRAKTWEAHERTWDKIETRLLTMKRTKETFAEYQAMSKADKSKIKDVGGFFGGTLVDGHRGNANVIDKSLITLDIDHLKGVTSDEVWKAVTTAFPNTAVVCYSTHSHKPDEPSLRLVMPIDKDVFPMQYEAISRRVAGQINIEWFDRTTFEFARFFYWPSAPKDAEIFTMSQKGSPIDSDSILSTYHDWRDTTEWPKAKDAVITFTNDIKYLDDPTKGKGIISEFCRAYSIEDGIEEFLSDVYKPSERHPHRFTYVNATGADGLAIYGQYAFSRHDSDPANNGHCHNIFDLVRIHKFGALDKGKTYGNIKDAPSYKAMLNFVSGKGITAVADFGGIDADNIETSWLASIRDKKGKIIPTVSNFETILENDPNLKGMIWKDCLSEYIKASKELIWRKSRIHPDDSNWDDEDENALCAYLEKAPYHIINGVGYLRRAISNVANRNERHPIREYLEALKWDGIERLDTAVIDYIGAKDTELNRAMTRKHLVAGVARVYDYGCQYDYCLTFTGAESIGKTQFCSILGGEWFSNSINTITGKEGAEQVSGRWIIEMGELAVLKRAETEQTKNYISRQKDFYRPAYGRYPREIKRQCIFFATTNEAKFLKGNDGSRKFWVIDVDRKLSPKFPDSTDKAIEALKQDRDQIWAEAMYRYKQGEKLYLSNRLEAVARKIQSEHNERMNDPIFTELSDFLEALLPDGWYTNYDLYKRRAFWDDYRAQIEGDNQEQDVNEIRILSPKGKHKRKFVCAKEYLTEYHRIDVADCRYRKLAGEVNKYIKLNPDWKPCGLSSHTAKVHNRQYSFMNITAHDEDANNDDDDDL